jgi:hypothetical protein
MHRECELEQDRKREKQRATDETSNNKAGETDTSKVCVQVGGMYRCACRSAGLR